MSVERVLVEKNVDIPMRDGVILRADVYRPADAHESGKAVPGVVTRTPYDKEVFGAAVVGVMPNALKLAERGYAVVVVDTRGRYASEGEFKPFHQEGPDGYDTLEWVAAQDWCDGGTAIYGPRTSARPRCSPPASDRRRCAARSRSSPRTTTTTAGPTRAARSSLGSSGCGAAVWRRRAISSRTTTARLSRPRS